MAYEALNNAARINKNFIIILNDNNMSISENVGGMSKYLSGIRTGAGYNDLKRQITGSSGEGSGGRTADDPPDQYGKAGIKAAADPGYAV